MNYFLLQIFLYALMVLQVHSTDQNETQNACSICYDTKYSVEVKIECNHKFCFDCINQWIKTQISTGHYGSCPVCRHELSNDIRVNEYILKRKVEDLTQEEKLKYFTVLPFCSNITNEDISKCITSGVDVNTTGINGLTVLMAATLKSNVRMVQFLIETHNEDINILASSGMPVFHVAANLGNLEIIRLLLEKGGVEQIYKTNLNGDNALHTASYFNDVEVLEFLLEHGSDANIDNVTAEGLTALHLACNRGQLDAVKLLMQHNADVNKENGKYRTPFHQAVAVGNLDIVKYLYENYDIQWTSTKEGLSSYSLAIVKQQPHIFDYLFENSKINATAVDLIVAVETNQLEIVEKLLKANVSQETTQMNILHVAANTGEIKMMKLLFEYGGKNNLNKVNNNGLTPLHVACLSSNANLEVVQCLLDHGANIDIVDIDTNPLHCAVLKGNFDIVKVLALSHKPQELDYKNVLRTALRTATELGRTEIAQFLSGILKHKGN